MKITELKMQEPAIKRPYEKPVLIHLSDHMNTEGKTANPSEVIPARGSTSFVGPS